MLWRIVRRRLEGFPGIISRQLFARIQFPAAFTADKRKA
jgi:hypothetical protein